MSDSFALDPLAVRRQFARRAGAIAQGDFLLREVERRMLERLEVVKLQPGAVLDVGCGLGQGTARLQQRFPAALVAGLDVVPAMVVEATRRHGRVARRSIARRLGDWFGAAGQSGATSPVFLAGDAAALPLRAASVDLIWSNLAWHWFERPDSVLADWYRAIRPGGLVSFTTFGVDTLAELARAGVTAPRLPDMHDIGDLLVSAGFADPVMDCEHLTITWKTAQALLADLRALGGNPLRARRPGLVGRATRERLLSSIDALRGSDGLISMRFEIVYGHAWCPSVKRLPAGLSPVNFVRNRPGGGAGKR